MKRARIRRGRREGFTLVELMVSIVAGLIAVMTIYSLANGATRHFQEQQRVSQTQTALRLAMEQIRADIERAGFGGTPSSNADLRCQNAPQIVQAVEFVDNLDTALLPFAAVNVVEADVLRLVGNYTTSGSYLAVGASGAGNTIQLQQTWQAFRRDFGVVGGVGMAAFAPETFTGVFAEGKVLHVESTQGFHFFPTITGSVPATFIITLGQSLPVGTPCLPGLADGAQVTPLSRIEYRVVDPSATPGLAALVSANPNAAGLGLNAPVLVRQELPFDGVIPIPGTTRVVLEYVADFDLAFMVNTATPGNVPIMERRAGAQAGALLARTPAAQPQRVRSVILSLSARSSDVDPRFPFVAGRPNRATPLTRYAVTATDADSPAARVRTVTTEIFLPNVAARNL